MPDGRWRGWAELLAPALSGPGWVELHNLAAVRTPSPAPGFWEAGAAARFVSYFFLLFFLSFLFFLLFLSFFAMSPTS